MEPVYVYGIRGGVKVVGLSYCKVIAVREVPAGVEDGDDLCAALHGKAHGAGVEREEFLAVLVAAAFREDEDAITFLKGLKGVLKPLRGVVLAVYGNALGVVIETAHKAVLLIIVQRHKRVDYLLAILDHKYQRIHETNMAAHKYGGGVKGRFLPVQFGPLDSMHKAICETPQA